MANVPANQTFIDGINGVVNTLIRLRDRVQVMDDANADLDPPTQAAVHARLAQDLAAVKAALAAVTAP